MWANNDCPCTKDCPERSGVCHGICPKYKTWAEKRAADKRAQAILAERNALTHQSRKTYMNSFRTDRSGAFKKFSG